MAGKEDIVTRIAHKSGLTKKATYKLMEAFKDVLTETLLDGERFHIHGLLTLKTELFSSEQTKKAHVFWAFFLSSY